MTENKYGKKNNFMDVLNDYKQYLTREKVDVA